MRQRIINWVSDHRIIGVLASLAVFVLIAFLVWGMVFRGDGKDKLVSDEPGGVGVPEYTTSVSGLVVDTSDNPIPGAWVRASGPYNHSEVEATFHETFTDDDGRYKIPLPVDGEYELLVQAEGFEQSLLVTGQGIEKIVGDFTVDDITLKKRSEIIQPTGSSGSSAYVYGKGVEKDEVARVLMSHGVINSLDEINEPVSAIVTGQGWTTYVRDGQSVSTQPIDYVAEPFWKVTFKEGRADGLKVIYVQRVCGNITVPPGEEVILPTLGITPTPVPSPTPSVTPTPIPTPRATLTPTPTPTPSSTPTPVPSKCLVTILGPNRLDNTDTHARMQASVQWDVRPNFTPDIEWYFDGVFIGGGEQVIFNLPLNEEGHVLLVQVKNEHGAVICIDSRVVDPEGSIAPGEDGPGTDPLPTGTPDPGDSDSDIDDGYSGPS